MWVPAQLQKSHAEAAEAEKDLLAVPAQLQKSHAEAAEAAKDLLAVERGPMALAVWRCVTTARSLDVVDAAAERCRFEADAAGPGDPAVEEVLNVAETAPERVAVPGKAATAGKTACANEGTAETAPARWSVAGMATVE